MTIEDLDKIDRTYLERATGKAVLVITDHLPWDVDEGRHLELLQAKVYRQLDAIESGELYERIAFTRGRPLAIAVYSLFDLSHDGQNLIDNLKQYLASMNIELRWILFEKDEPTPTKSTPQN